MTIMVEVDGKFHPLPKADAPNMGASASTWEDEYVTRQRQIAADQAHIIYSVRFIEETMPDHNTDADHVDASIHYNIHALRPYVVVIGGLFFNSHDDIVSAMRDVRLMLRFVCYIDYSVRVLFTCEIARLASRMLDALDDCPDARAWRLSKLSKRIKT